MNPASGPPQRPRARAMLDASEKQTVGTPEREVVSRASSSSISQTAASVKLNSGALSAGTKKPATGPHRASSPRSASQPVGSVRRSGLGRPGTNGPGRSKPTPQKPADAAKANRRPIKIHTKRAPLKWSFGGLTVSVRLLVMLAVVGVLIVTLVPLGLQWVRQEQAYHSAVNEVTTAQARADELRDELDQWNQEDYIAAEARERLGYVRPGETQYVITDAPEPVEDTEDAESHNNAAGPAKPWAWVVLESLKDADEPPASAGLVDSGSTGDGE